MKCEYKDCEEVETAIFGGHYLCLPHAKQVSFDRMMYGDAFIIDPNHHEFKKSI